MNSRRSTSNDIRRGEGRQTLEPQTGSLYFAVTELPRLKNLTLPNTDQRLSVTVHNRILDTYLRDRLNPQVMEELGSFLHKLPSGMIYAVGSLTARVEPPDPYREDGQPSNPKTALPSRLPERHAGNAVQVSQWGAGHSSKRHDHERGMRLEQSPNIHMLRVRARFAFFLFLGLGCFDFGVSKLL